jgi:hypothetical protein
MRVVCWNVRGSQMDSRVGTRGSQVGLIDYLERWSADVAIILEPPETLRRVTRLGGDVITRRDTDASADVATTWRTSTYLQGHPQGHLAVVFNQTTVDATILRGFPVPGGGAHDNHLVYLRLDEKAPGTGRWVVVSCHTPFVDHTAANQFNRKALTEVIQKPHFGTPANHPDIWIGDLNAYSPVMFSSREAGAYQELPFGPTSGFGRNGGRSHSRLDRILHKITSPVAAHGRVIPNDLTPSTGDLSENTWTSRTVPSDHLPIYVDSTPVAAAVPAPPPVAPMKRTGPSDPMPPDPPSIKRRRMPPPPPGT